MKKQKITTRFLTLCALMAAVLSIIGPMSVPIGPVHLSLATFVVYLFSIILGARISFWSVLCYLLLGAVGLPVFSGYMGGLAKLVGPTGGYLVGYLALAVLTGGASEKFGVLGITLGMILGTLVCYCLGTIWFIIQMGCTLSYALTVCVIPFLAFDAGKMAIALFLGSVIKSRLSHVLIEKK